MESAVNGTGVSLDDDTGDTGSFTPEIAPLARLCAIDTLFTAQGTVNIKVGQRIVTLPVQSVDTEVIDAFVRAYRPVPPTRTQLENGRRVVIENQADRTYQEKLTEYNRIWLLAVAFHGLAIDIVDAMDHVVWSADNVVHDLPATRAAVKKMGLVDNQLSDIVKAINDLTKFADETQGRD